MLLFSAIRILFNYYFIISILILFLLKKKKRYKERLNLYANKTGKSFLFYERNVPTQYGDVHFHIQCIPVPSNSSELLLKAFQEKSGEYHLSFLHIKDPSLPIRNVLSS